MAAGFGSKGRQWGDSQGGMNSGRVTLIPPPDIPIRLPFTKEVGGITKSWARILSTMGPTQNFGVQPMGAWLKEGDNPSVGEIVAVGYTDPNGKKHHTLYVVTPDGYLSNAKLTLKTAEHYINLSYDARIERAYTEAISDCDDYVNLMAFILDGSAVPIIPMYMERKKLLRGALNNFLSSKHTQKTATSSASESSVQSVALDEMFVELVKAGYRALALKYHPDQNKGDDSKMLLVSECRQQLKELLKLSGVQGTDRL